MFKERISCPEAALTAPFPGYRLADCENAAASLHRHLHRFSQLHHHRFMFLSRRQGAVDPDAVAILARRGKQRPRRDLDLQPAQLFGDADHIHLLRELNPQHKTAVRPGDADPAGEQFPPPAGVDLAIALLDLPHPPHVAVVVAFANQITARQLCGRDGGSPGGALHL